MNRGIEMTSKETNFVSAVIYIHNVENQIADFLSMLIFVMENNFEHSEIICINDASEDESVQIIKTTSKNANSTSVSIINMSYFHGLESAMNAGVDLAIGDFVFEFDNSYCDFHQEKIMEVYKRALQGYDIVSASPNRKEKFNSGIFYKMFELFDSRSHKMSTERFRITSRRAINRINSLNRSIPYRKALYTNCGLKTDNIKYDIINTSSLQYDSKEKSYRLGLAVDSLILFTDVGYKFSIVMTIVMMLMSIFMVIYSIIIYATLNPISGWTTTILFISLVFFGLFGILTIVIKYLQLLVDLVFKRKYYNFESIEKLN